MKHVKGLLLFVAILLFAGIAMAAVNINTASQSELESLPGIGPVKAKAIIDYRQQNGAFKTPEDIMKVKGIKQGEFGKIKGDISVSGASTPLAAERDKLKGTTRAESTKATASATKDASPSAAKAEMPAKSSDKSAKSDTSTKSSEKSAKGDTSTKGSEKSAKSDASTKSSDVSAKAESTKSSRKAAKDEASSTSADKEKAKEEKAKR